MKVEHGGNPFEGVVWALLITTVSVIVICVLVEALRFLF